MSSDNRKHDSNIRCCALANEKQMKQDLLVRFAMQFVCHSGLVSPSVHLCLTPHIVVVSKCYISF